MEPNQAVGEGPGYGVQRAEGRGGQLNGTEVLEGSVRLMGKCVLGVGGEDRVCSRAGKRAGREAHLRRATRN